MGIANALADVLLEGRVSRAKSNARFAEDDASDANSRADDAETDLRKEKRKTRALQERVNFLEQSLAETKATCSAGLVVVNAMVKVMESMSTDQREQFRAEVAKLALARMRVLDEQKGNAVAGIAHASIEKAFAAKAANQILRIV